MGKECINTRYRMSIRHRMRVNCCGVSRFTTPKHVLPRPGPKDVLPGYIPARIHLNQIMYACRTPRPIQNRKPSFLRKTRPFSCYVEKHMYFCLLRYKLPPRPSNNERAQLPVLRESTVQVLWG